MSFVLDASATMAWCFDDERTEQTDALLVTVSTSSAHVPALWVLEVANILRAAHRRKRIDESHIRACHAMLAPLSLHIDRQPAPPTRAGWTRYVRKSDSLSLQHNLSAYDATYLELATRLHLPLATLDRDLAAAAAKTGVSLVLKLPNSRQHP
jgi:predicted nucleic acid-binding protein